ncbi:delta-class carbonic anhydrase [Vibrio scophthalmi]|uniref:delta-class carbonic anhydrase n=1 Tax=Vibrio scophthalmi TaxID=45658 RepID=UPI00228494C5|nr:delta-class carbonic anhydrase [Vibrio scophthalmi]MCY9804832.1 delta-class carbonic anhydrase [Vibrio scophthalmi]
MNTKLLITSLAIISAAPTVFADTVDDYVIAEQRVALQENTQGKGFGPQSPRDIDSLTGKNQRVFNTAPAASQMNLCNIHFHKNAEHKGGEFNKYAGNGDGKGNNTGYLYTGKLTKEELKPFNQAQSSLQSGDTIELHYVYTTAQVKPGPTLGSCLSDSVMNPQLRVETQVSVLVNDKNALDFETLTAFSLKNSYYQALNIPNNTGTPIQYAGSTTGPSYNEQGSPLQVTWSVRPQVNKVDIASVEKWLEGNDFKENHAHGVRNLVVNPDLLSSGH